MYIKWDCTLTAQKNKKCGCACNVVFFSFFSVMLCQWQLKTYDTHVDEKKKTESIEKHAANSNCKLKQSEFFSQQNPIFISNQRVKKLCAHFLTNKICQRFVDIKFLTRTFRKEKKNMFATNGENFFRVCVLCFIFFSCSFCF